MGLALRMALYAFFAMLAKEGFVIFDPEAGTVTIQIEHIGMVVSGVTGYLGTFAVGRWAKARGGAT